MIKIKKEYLDAFRRFFIGRSDTFAYYTNSGKSFRDKTNKLTDKWLIKHLNKEITLGTYLSYRIDEKVYQRAIMIDIDSHNNEYTKEQLKTASFNIRNMIVVNYQIPKGNCVRVFSGRGVHIWIKLKDLTLLEQAYGLTEYFRNDIGIKGLEIFPKSNYVAEDGFGTMCKLPLSINRKNGEFCYFIDNLDLLSQGSGYEIPDSIYYRKHKDIKGNFELPDAIVGATTQDYINKLRPCIQKLLKEDLGHGITSTGRGHSIRMVITACLYALGAPVEVRVNVFKNQPYFRYNKTLAQIEDLERRAERNNTSYRPSCKNLKGKGLCLYEKLKDCPYRKNKRRGERY